MTDSTFQVAKRYVVSYLSFNYCSLGNTIKLFVGFGLGHWELGDFVFISSESLLIYRQRLYT